MWQSTYKFCMANEEKPCKEKGSTPIGPEDNREIVRTITIYPW